MPLLILRLTPATRYTTALAKLQKALRLPPDKLDLDPGVMLGVVPDTVDMSRVLAVFNNRTVIGEISGLTTQEETNGKKVVVLTFAGGLAETVKDFAQFSVLKDLGGPSMTLAMGEADPDLIIEVTEQSEGHSFEFDRLEAISLDTGEIVEHHDLGEDNDNDTDDDDD